METVRYSWRIVRRQLRRMKTHSPLVSHPPHQYRPLCTALLIFVTAYGHAACGSGSGAITNVPHLGGSTYTVTSLNAIGQVAGYSFTPGDTESHAFLFSSGNATDLGSLGGTTSYGYALNDSGQVVGESLLPGDFAPPHAFLFNGTAMVDLGTLGGISSTAVGINNAGQVTGTLRTAGDTDEAFLYSNGTLTSLGHLGGFYSRAAAINQSGNVAGNSLTDFFERHAFLTINGTMIDLGSLGSGYSDAFAVNDANVVVGESYLASGELHGFVYANGTMTDLGTLGGTGSTAYQINSAGQIIGRSTTFNDAETHGFVYSGGTMTDLGTLGGTSTSPSAINNLGQIVGQSDLADGTPQAFLWQNGAMTNLNLLLPPNSGWVLHNARFINDSGRIVGNATYNDEATWFILDLGGNNSAPNAVAQADQTSACNGMVTLDGTQSSDPDGDVLAYEWSENGAVLGTNAMLSVSLATGAHTLTLRVSDPCGESSLATVSVAVGDTTPPTVSCPANVTPSGSNSCEASMPDLRTQVVVSDNCTAANNLIVTQSPAPGTILGAGQYVVTVTATDASGNVGSCSTTITVGDDAPPVIVRMPRPFTLSTGDDCQAKVPDLTRFVRAQDNCTPAKSLLITQSPAAGTLLDQGEHTILLTVTDAAGNSATKGVAVHIKDCLAPKIHSITATPNVLSPANGAPITMQVAVTATDNCDDAPSSKIVSIVCDEHASRGDIRITGNLTAELTATASQRGNGRVYTIIVACKDDSGNTTWERVKVRVPKTSNDHPHRK
jgi:probable HAF family extracellular repeat protein